MRFEQLNGVHGHLNGVDTKKGDVVESDDRLDKAFPGRFRLMSEQEAASVVVAASSAPSEATVAVAGEVEADVTAEFPEAAAIELRVMKRGDAYVVFDGEELLTQPGETLTAGQVVAFVNKFTAGA